MEWGSLHNAWLFIFAIAFAVVALFLFQWKLKIRKNFADANLLQQLMPNISFANFWLKAILIFIAIVLLILALMDPLFGTKQQTVKKEGIDIVFALDVSVSMNTEDIAPNRLAKAKKIIQETVQNFGGDRVGLVIFAGTAHAVSPLTSDYVAIDSYLESISTDLIAQQGTNMPDAIFESLKVLNNTNNRAKSIVLISDGENHEEKLTESINFAKEKGVQIITLGIGTEKGAPIPIKEFDQIVDYKKDNYGNTVISKLAAQDLKRIATDTDASYISVKSTGETVNRLSQDLSKLEKTQYGEVLTEQKNHVFQWFLIVAVILLFIDSLTSERKLFS